MKINLVIAFLFALSFTVFGQKGTDASTEKIDPTFQTMSLEKFIESGVLSKEELAIFDVIHAEKVSPCSSKPKQGNCFTATTTKYNTCAEFEKEVQHGNVTFANVSYGGCESSEGKLHISVIAEKEAPTKEIKE